MPDPYFYFPLFMSFVKQGPPIRPQESYYFSGVYAFLVTMFVYRDCKWRDLPKLIARVVRTVGMVMIMIGFSIAFGYMMAILQVPATAAAFRHLERQI